ncbi:MAG: response regulator [Patescibacteria group bacterium]
MSDVKKKILIVEDQKSLAEMYKTRFEFGDYEVKLAYDGLAAVTLAPEFLPDAILLDVMMPTMDGIETLQVLRRNAPSVHTKIVVFSNLDDPKTIAKCKEFGADEYVLKVSVTPGQIFNLIDGLVDKSRANAAGAAVKELPPEEAGRICPCCNRPL